MWLGARGGTEREISFLGNYGKQCAGGRKTSGYISFSGGSMGSDFKEITTQEASPGAAVWQPGIRPRLRGPLYASGRSQQGAQQKPSGAAPRSPACSPRPRAAQPQERQLESEPRVASRRREHLRGRTAYGIGSQRSATLTGAAQGEPSSLQDAVQDVGTP